MIHRGAGQTGFPHAYAFRGFYSYGTSCSYRIY